MTRRKTKTHQLNIKRYELNNGLRILVCERHHLPVVCTMIWYCVGSRNEILGETGVSHFLEHMMFKGTRKYGKGVIDRITAQQGGSNNAFTNTDYTAYYFNFPSYHWQTALHIEADRMRNCRIHEKEFQAEKQVILEELKMGKDDPWRDLYEEVQSQVYSVHPYRNPVIGWESDIRALPRKRMLNYYRRFYTPNRAVIVVAGEVQADAVFRACKKLFAKIPAHQELSQEIIPEPAQRGERRLVQLRPTQTKRMVLAYKTCRVNEPDDYVLDVLAVILGHGKSSRLYRNLITKGWATGISAENDPRIDTGIFWLGIELAYKKREAQVESLLLREVEQVLCKTLAKTKELARAKRLVEISFLAQQESCTGIAEKIGRWEIQASAKFINQYLTRINQVTPAAIRQTARKYFRSANRTVGWSVSEDK